MGATKTQETNVHRYASSSIVIALPASPGMLRNVNLAITKRVSEK
jgi:hypothetical protein